MKVLRDSESSFLRKASDVPESYEEILLFLVSLIVVSFLSFC